MIKPEEVNDKAKSHHPEGNKEVNFSVGFSVDSFIAENSNNKMAN